MYSVWIVPLRIKLPLKSSENCSYLAALAADDGRIFLKKILFLNIAQFGCGLILKVVILKSRLAVHVVDHYAKSWPGSRDLAQALAACKKIVNRGALG